MAIKLKGRNKRIKVGPGHHWIMPNKQKMWVSAYAVTRHYGGPEEGGWWYDWYEHIATYPRRVKSIRLPMVHAKMRKQYGWIQDEYDRSSVRGGTDLVIVNERIAGESRSTSRPHYE